MPTFENGVLMFIGIPVLVIMAIEGFTLVRHRIKVARGHSIIAVHYVRFGAEVEITYSDGSTIRHMFPTPWATEALDQSKKACAS